MGRYRGFTLIELLASLVIIGVMISLAVFAVGGDRKIDQARTERDRLMRLLELAGEEAILNNQSLALNVYRSGYRFEHSSADGWMPLETDRLLRARSLPEYLTLELTIEGQAIPLERKAAEKPQLFLLASGEYSPFSLSIVLDRDLAVATIKGNGFHQPEAIDEDIER